ncbi:MAG: cytochrome c biogenesis protein ResB [Oscillospiraceae bacterium]|nr:cytochrome c biogenesis protein ResB [Oscillospiraceae bacterium]
MQKRLMKFLRSMTFGMILLGLILLCSFPGSVIAQGNTPDWYVQTYPDWHGVILKLGLDDVFGSWFFITLLALLCLNLTLCSLIRIRNVVKASKKAAASAAERKTKVFLTAEGTSQLRQLLEERHYKKEVFGETTVYSKNSIGWYGSFVTHLAILLTVLFGAAALYLPKVTDQTCFPGESLPMEDGTSIAVESFQIENGEGKLDYASVIEIRLPDGRTSGQQRISVNYPLSFGGYKVYQQTYGTAGAVTVRNTETGGEDRFLLNEMCFLSLDSINGIWFEALYPGYIRDESGNFTLITQTTGSYEDPVYQVLLASEGVYTPVMVFPGETLSVGGVEFTFEDPVEYPGLRIKRTPEAVNVMLFSAFGLMILGLWFCFFQTPAIVAVREEGYTVAGPKPQGLILELTALLESEIRNEETLC